MGRRSVPKSARSIDASRCLRSADELIAPWDPGKLFASSGPIEIEVGTGKGLFLINAAAALPDHNFLGIEIAKPYAALTASRIARQSLTNALMVHGDAQPIFRDLLPEASIQAVHVYFPDPWWKKRHRKRRVMNEAFVNDVQRVLVPGGRLHFWTDVKEYFDEATEMVAAKTSLDGPFDVETRPALHDLDYHTHFERRVRMNGLPVYRSEFIKPVWRIQYTVDAGFPGK